MTITSFHDSFSSPVLIQATVEQTFYTKLSNMLRFLFGKTFYSNRYGTKFQPAKPWPVYVNSPYIFIAYLISCIINFHVCKSFSDTKINKMSGWTLNGYKCWKKDSGVVHKYNVVSKLMIRRVQTTLTANF